MNRDTFKLAQERIESILRERGFTTKTEEHEEGVTIKAHKGDLSLSVLLLREAGKLKELRIDYGKCIGLTIIECEKLESIEKCISKFIEELRAC